MQCHQIMVQMSGLLQEVDPSVLERIQTCKSLFECLCESSDQFPLKSSLQWSCII